MSFKVVIPQTAGIEELKKIMETLLNYLVDDGKLTESTAKNIVTEGMRG